MRDRGLFPNTSRASHFSATRAQWRVWVASEKRPGQRPQLSIPDDLTEAPIKIGGRSVRLTNLQKPFWPDLGVTKRDLLQYYADVAPLLLPHLVDRAMVMKRYPDGAAGKFFFMKRAPTPRPEWIRVCSIPHRSGNVIGRYYKTHPVMFGEYVPFAEYASWLNKVTPIAVGLSVGEGPKLFDVEGVVQLRWRF